MKFILFSIFLFLCNNCISQDVLKFKCFQTAANEPGSDEDIKWKDRDILLVLDVQKSKIHIYSQEDQDIDIIIQNENFTNSDGDNILKYTGVDQNGKKCNIVLKIFKDQSTRHTATLIIEYSDIHFLYRLEKD